MRENCKLLIVFLKLLMLLQRLPVDLLHGEISPFGVQCQVYSSHSVMLKMLNVRLRWWHFMASLLQISFKFLSFASPTRHLIQVLKGYFMCFYQSSIKKKGWEHFIQKWNSNSLMCWLSLSIKQKFVCLCFY